MTKTIPIIFRPCAFVGVVYEQGFWPSNFLGHFPPASLLHYYHIDLTNNTTDSDCGQ